LKFAKIDHVSVPVNDVERSRDFYSRVLGLQEIPRPSFSFAGIWYKLGDVAIHIIENEVSKEDPDRSDLSTRYAHIAFFMDTQEELKKFIEKIKAENIPWYELENSPTGLHQVFFKDPDGNMIEVLAPNPQNPYYESVYLKYMAGNAE